MFVREFRSHFLEKKKQKLAGLKILNCLVMMHNYFNTFFDLLDVKHTQKIYFCFD